jgi:signal transduction histidine kinase
MDIKKIFAQLNIIAQCRKYGLSLWQCPRFLFVVMGLIIIVSTIATYLIGQRYIEDPGEIALIVLLLAAVLFIISFVITGSFEKLAEANRMKSEFISIVSHQLRSPLSNLKWATEFLMSGRMGSIAPEQLEYFKIIKENVGRMGELISDLLIVSRIEQGTLPLKKREINFEELIRGLIKDFEPFAKASNIEISFNPQAELPKISVDPSQMKVVIENLLDNAIRYINPVGDYSLGKETKKGKIEIKVERRRNNIYFEIKDNGVGIPKEDQKYIFQKFFRSENVMRYQTRGSGLGLYITKAIIEKSGGKIGFDSEEFKGTRFWFTLPYQKLM